MLVQTNKIVAFLLPFIFIVVVSIQVYVAGESTFLIDVGRFYVFEASFVLFAIKSLITSVLFFLGAFALENRLEVAV
jgi:hypothetical protein